MELLSVYCKQTPEVIKYLVNMRLSSSTLFVIHKTGTQPEDAANSFTYRGTSYPATLICDLLHTEGAEALSFYEKDFYAGMPTLTSHLFGKGYAYYVATRSNANGTFLFLNHDGKKHNILLNHAGTDILTSVSYEKGSRLLLPAKGVAILRIGYGVHNLFIFNFKKLHF